MKNKINKNVLLLILRIIILFVIFFGLYLYFSKQGIISSIIYFNSFINMFAFIYFIIITIKEPKYNKINSYIKGSIFLCMLVTILTFHFISRPVSLRMINGKYVMSLSNILINYISPMLIIIEWISSKKDKDIMYSDALKWLIIPFIYLLTIIIFGLTGYTYPDSLNNYPYFFLDTNKYGELIVIRNVIFLGSLFYLLGIFTIFVHKNIIKYKNKSLS